MKKSLFCLLAASNLILPSSCGGRNSGPPPPAAATHLSVTAPATGTAGAALNFTVTALDSSNGVVSSYAGTVHFTSSDGQAMLPANSTLTNGTGRFSATLKTTANQTITATDTVTASITGTSSPINVTTSTVLTITSGAPPNGTVGVNYGPSSTEYLKCFWNPYRGWHLVCNPCSSPSACTSLPPCSGNIYQSPCRETKQVFLGFTLTAARGLPPYTWVVASGSSLPPGLHLTTSGMIAGKPTRPGTYNVTVTVSDSASPATHASANYKIVIAPPPPPVINAVALLPIGTLGSPYVGFAFTATSEAPPLTWSETGALPLGMSLGPDGALSGKPSVAGTFPVTVMVEDSFGQDGTPQSFVIQVLTQGFLPTGSMETPRASHTATLLNTGKVLVTGGASSGASALLATAELFDPIGETFSSTGSMGTARVSHTATLLADGRVLVTGGRDTTDNPVSTAEIFDPVKGTFSPTGSMETTRLYNTATLLKTGKVLVTGGLDAAGNFLATAELLDPTTRMFTPTGNMVTPRAGHTATLFSDGKVLVAGGDTATAEIFDPATGTFTPTGSMETARVDHTATLLKSGKVLVTGGQDTGSNSLASAEVFDPVLGTFTPTSSMETARVNHTAVSLNDGTVLVAGGDNSSNGLSFSSAELFNPASGSFTPTADMTAARASHAATLLINGKVLVTGGQNRAGTLATAELYQ